MVDRIADKVNVDKIDFVHLTRNQSQKAVVTLTKQGRLLSFNSKMVKLLNMKDWESVVVGFDSEHDIIVLKHSEPEEYGSVVVQKPSKHALAKDMSPKAKNKLELTRRISIKHLIRETEGTFYPSYKAERNGVMIFLEPINAKE